MSTLTSVIVCTYNRCESLRTTLEALAAQTLQAGLAMEVVVVDNNSRDQTPQVVQEAAVRNPWPVRYVVEPQQGLSYARNRGIGEAAGEVVAFTDDDALPEPGWVRTLVQAMTQHRADAAGGKILPRWLATPPAWLTDGMLRQELWDTLALLDHGPEIVMADGTSLNVLYGANMAFRKSVFQELGGFRTDLGRRGAQLSGGDDTDIVGRLLKAGKRIVYTPNATVHHTIGAERMHKAYFRRWKFHSGQSIARWSPFQTRCVPKWLVREWVQHGLGSLWAYGRRQRDLGLQRELKFWYQLGQITETLRQSSRETPQVVNL